ncbi:MAG: histidine kinase dimerization/phosphoacceptor domain -containing protein [Bacteroidota bacterium]
MELTGFDALERACPFYFIIDAKGYVVQSSQMWEKTLKFSMNGKFIDELFELSKSVEEMAEMTGKGQRKLFFLSNKKGVQKFKAGVELFENDNLLFLCNPVLNSQLNLKDYDLTLNDFPVHDSIAEYVFTQNSFVATQMDALEIYDKLEKKNAELKSFLNDLESKNRDLEMLLGEVHHRVKNNLAFINSLLEIESNFSNSKSKEEILSDIKLRIRFIARIHEIMYQSNSFSSINIQEYFRSLVDEVFAFYRPPGHVNIQVEIENIFVSQSELLPLAMIVVELLTNVFKHGFFNNQDAYLTFTIGKKENYKILRVSNSAVQTKSANSGTGSLLIDIFTRQLKGKKEIRQGIDGFHIEISW